MHFEDTDFVFPVHLELIVRNGIYILENLNPGSLTADRMYEFALVFAPVKFKGGTGWLGNPVAIK